MRFNSFLAVLTGLLLISTEAKSQSGENHLEALIEYYARPDPSPREVIRLANKVLALEKNCEAYWRRGWGYFNTNLYLAAEIDFKKALDYGCSNDSWTWYHYGESLHQNADYSAAIRAFSKSINFSGDGTLESTDWPGLSYANRGKSYIKLDDLRLGCQDLKTAANLGIKETANIYQYNCQNVELASAEKVATQVPSVQMNNRHLRGDKCINATDYKGCMEYYSDSDTTSSGVVKERFFNDELLKKEMRDWALNDPDMGLSSDITSNQLRDYRLGQCLYHISVNRYPSNKVKSWCKSNALKHASGLNSAPEASIARHPQCLPNNSKICIVTTGRDILDMPVIPGWYRLQNHAKRTVQYFRPDVQKVNVRGSTNRYLSQETVFRYYRAPRAGTSPTTTTIGSYNSSCNATGYGVSCTTTPPQQITTPGISARPGGVIQQNNHYIYDCEDKTRGFHVNGELRGKWNEVASLDRRAVIDKYCPIINSLSLSDFTKYRD